MAGAGVVTALFERPMVDPEAHEPTTSVMVDEALDTAGVASAEVCRLLRSYLEALERNDVDLAERLAELDKAVRHTRYAWAIYHCAKADAAAQRVA